MKATGKIPKHYRPHLINLKLKRGMAYIMFKILENEKRISKQQLFEKVNQHSWTTKCNSTLNGAYRTLKYLGAVNDNNLPKRACMVWYVKNYFIGNIEELLDNEQTSETKKELIHENKRSTSMQQEFYFTQRKHIRLTLFLISITH